MIQILLVDDSYVVRQTLKSMLAPELDLEVVGEAESGQAALELLETLQPDVVLLDIEMPGMDGLAAAKLMLQRYPQMRVMILSNHEDEKYIQQSLAMGARGYLLKNTPAHELAQAIRLTDRGYLQLGPGLPEKSITRAILPATGDSIVRTAASTATVTARPAITPHSTALVHSATAAPVLSKPGAITLASKSGAIAHFDQPVMLQQSPSWSRALIWGMIGVTTAGVVWASLAKIEQAIQVQGKLEPQGTVKEVQSPVNGVVKAVYVEEGQTVQAGARLLSLDPTAAQAQIKSLQAIRDTLVQENQFYRAQQQASNGVRGLAVPQLRLPAQLVSLAENRAALVAENQLYQAELQGTTTALNTEQLQRLRSSQAELKSRSAAAQLEVEQLQQQLNQVQTQLASVVDLLKVNQQILADVEPVAREGGLARLQFRRQEQEVLRSQTEVKRLTQEQGKLKAAIAQAQKKLQNTLDLSQKDLLTKIADNQKRIAEIDSQFTKVTLDNQKRIAEIDNQLSQAKLTLQYQDLRAPVAGAIFELKAREPGYVATASQPILKIVPQDSLVAKVFITNRDIGFVKTGMQSDVRVDSFPFSEFGDIKGEVVAIGSDALAPEPPIRPYFSFPAKIRLNTQTLKTPDRTIPLQSGMSVSANLKLRQRSVLSLFTDLFIRKAETLKYVR